MFITRSSLETTARALGGGTSGVIPRVAVWLRRRQLRGRRQGRKSNILIAWGQDEVERVVFLQQGDEREELHLLFEG